MASGSRTCSLTLFESPILVELMSSTWLGKRRFALVHPSIANVYRRTVQIRRGFSPFAKLRETSDCAGQKGETNQQEGNPEAACITEPIADPELDVEIG